MDLSVLPTLCALTVFVCSFRPLVRRVGPQTNVWFLGWTFLLVHYVALMPQFPPNGLKDDVTTLLSIWGSELCGLCFIFAASRLLNKPHAPVLALEIAAPVLFQSLLYSMLWNGTWMRTLATLLLLVPALHLVLVPRHRCRDFNAIAGGLAVLALCLLPFGHANPFIALNLVEGALFLSAACLMLLQAKGWVRGTVLMIAGLILWGLSYSLQAVGWVEAHVHLSHTILDIPRYMVAAGMILSLLDEYVSRAESLALHDPLTGLPNRRLFDNRMEEALEEAQRTLLPVACLVIDVDKFKYINDTFGHPVGDGLLRALAKRLSWNLGPRDMLARTGGDEFTAIIVEGGDEYHLRFVAGAMMAAGCVPVSIDQHLIDVHLSIGIAVAPHDAVGIAELHRTADEAMYRAKRRGGSGIAFAHEEAEALLTV